MRPSTNRFDHEDTNGSRDPSPIRVRIELDPDRHLLASATATMLSRAPGIILVGLRVDRSAGPAVLGAQPCDVAIVDRADLASSLKQAASATQTIMFVKKQSVDTVLVSLRAGAAACIDERLASDAMVDTVRRVAAGEIVYDPVILATCLQLHSVRRPTPDRTAQLSERELEVLTVLAHGVTCADAARQFGISLNTLRTHIRNVLAKMDARSQLEAVVVALREGRISLNNGDG